MILMTNSDDMPAETEDQSKRFIPCPFHPDKTSPMPMKLKKPGLWICYMCGFMAEFGTLTKS